MDVIQEAEQVVRSLSADNYGNIYLTKTQIRKLLSAVNAINNKLMVYLSQRNDAEAKSNELPQELAAEIRYLEVKLLYQAGRGDKNVREFVDKAKMRERITKAAQGVSEYKEFAQFMEAVVAFHKFHGGKD